MLQDIRLAIIVNPELPPGHLANTIAAISIGIGSAMPDLGNRQLTDSRENTIDISSNRPVPILQADSQTIGALLLRALPKEERRIVVPFPAFARSMHSYADYEGQFPERDLSAETIDGIGLAGASKWVKSLTGSLKLLR
ncbi:DUF2000 domain-containing protein [Ensifer adhaerens]|uniref:DUF2000 domain-containing protein n=1 Tax=Ensifer adhaerens TaxID=106592 RepID=UPI000DE56FD4|nr:DUF2000 domain-containing protein [Ensifer adhaerens]MBZ7924675.1 DUF2000 domain-containing protein [Ensifer adhaerens]UAX96095.1 DUF2000 domain-containing protein [Ensifer adhaerens]UAY04563.1 DUF2000 domain-containing protein [Ensifer adhaerens]UAY09995.1 DUF2000 domain-containing protein [Ensifer adhaerens]